MHFSLTKSIISRLLTNTVSSIHQHIISITIIIIYTIPRVLETIIPNCISSVIWSPSIRRVSHSQQWFHDIAMHWRHRGQFMSINISEPFTSVCTLGNWPLCCFQPDNRSFLPACKEKKKEEEKRKGKGKKSPN